MNGDDAPRGRSCVVPVGGRKLGCVVPSNSTQTEDSERTMPNWLEEEERKQSIETRRSELEYKNKKAKEEEVLKRLSTFHALCQRVNGVRLRALSIDQFKVEGPPINLRSTYGRKLTGKRRGVRISCNSEGMTFIDLVVTELSDSDDYRDPIIHRDIVLVRKACSDQELSDWREDQILHTIQWMMNEAEPSAAVFQAERS
jgi:hypothetical protein